MGKKRSRVEDAAQDIVMSDGAAEDNKVMMSGDSSDDEDDVDIINVDFELFNYDSTIDFHGVKTLLRQLFDADAQLLDLSGLSDAIVEQNTIGSTCKVDAKENDAYAFLTVLNLREQAAARPCVAILVDYLADRARTSESLVKAGVPELIASQAKKGEEKDKGTKTKEPVVGVVLAERLLNMPAEVIPPMWRCMIDEIEAAVEDGEPYEFTHYLVVSRAYREVESSLDNGAKRDKKRSKIDASGMQFFHPEDEEMAKFAAASGTYEFSKEGESVADSKRAFQEMGVKPAGFMMLIEAKRFDDAVNGIQAYVGGST